MLRQFGFANENKLIFKPGAVVFSTDFTCQPLKIFLEHFVSDQLPLEKTPQTFRLLPETVNTLSENGSDTNEINEQQDVDKKWNHYGVRVQSGKDLQLIYLQRLWKNLANWSCV